MESQFRVLLFAILRDVLKRDEVEIMISTSAEHTVTVADLLSVCTQQFPELADWLPHIRVAVNCEYSTSETVLSTDDEIAFIPPVAGG